MSRFTEFTRERQYLHNVSPGTLRWYERQYLANVALSYVNLVIRKPLTAAQLLRLPADQRRHIVSRAQGAWAVTFCFTIADDFRSTGTPCIK
jgi:hypothetical protein